MAPGTTIMSKVYCETLNNLQRLIKNKQREMLTKGVILLHDNAHPHTATHTNALIRLFNWEIFDHPPYSPELAPSDYHLFTKMKDWLATIASTTMKSSWIESTNGCITWQQRSLTRDYKN
jgi:histone-lysine N-methyltransferase SETMAR